MATACRSHVHDSTMQDLAKFLQDTGSAIEWILVKHKTSTLKTPNSDLSDAVRTSLSIGIPSTGHRSLQQEAGCLHQSSHERDIIVAADRLAAGDDSSLFEEDDGVRAFVEEIQQTVSTWSAKHEFMLQNKAEAASRDSVAGSPSTDVRNDGALRSNSDAWHGGPCVPTEELDHQSVSSHVRASAPHEFLSQTNTAAAVGELNGGARDVASDGEIIDSARDAANGDDLPTASTVWKGGPATALQESLKRDHESVSSQAPVVESQAADEPCPKDYSEVVGTLLAQTGSDEQGNDHALQPEVDKSSSRAPAYEEIETQLLDTDDGESHSKEKCHELGLSKKEEAPKPSIAEKLQNSLQLENEKVEGDILTGTEKETGATPASDMFLTPKGDKPESKLPLTKYTTPVKDLWFPNSTATKTRISLTGDVKPQMRQRDVQIISSPDWLPQGWVTELKIRGSGNSAGSKDKYYVDPVSKRRFRSRKEVFSFLETGKVNRYRKRSDTSPVRKLLGGTSPVRKLLGGTSPVRKLLGADISSAPPKHLSKKTKTKHSTASSSVGHSSPIVPSMGPPSGLMGNMYTPFRAGQPSDWLVYDGLSSLPFPMFSPFQYGDYNSNKSSSSKAPPPAMRPWFFPGPESSWRPYWDQNNLGKPGEKNRSYHGMYPTTPPPPPPAFYPELASRAGGGRKSTKRNSNGGM